MDEPDGVVVVTNEDVTTASNTVTSVDRVLSPSSHLPVTSLDIQNQAERLSRAEAETLSQILGGGGSDQVSNPLSDLLTDSLREDIRARARALNGGW